MMKSELKRALILIKIYKIRKKKLSGLLNVSSSVGKEQIPNLPNSSR